MIIEMPRGDIRPVPFTVSDESGGFTDIQFDEIYFTVKRTFRDKNYLIQKRLSDNGIEALGEGQYQFTVMPKDTDHLQVGKYVFDIELVCGNAIKQTFVGDFVLTNEVTFAANEV